LESALCAGAGAGRRRQRLRALSGLRLRRVRRGGAHRGGGQDEHQERSDGRERRLERPEREARTDDLSRRSLVAEPGGAPRQELLQELLNELVHCVLFSYGVGLVSAGK